MTTLIILLVAVLLGMYNGQFITGASKSWHGTGFVIRALLMFVLWPDPTLMVVYFWIAWVAYDLIINFYMKVPWHYQGETAWFDLIPRGVIFFLKICLTFAALALVLINWVCL
jgi:hypothetical protein